MTEHKSKCKKDKKTTYSGASKKIPTNLKFTKGKREFTIRPKEGVSEVNELFDPRCIPEQMNNTEESFVQSAQMCDQMGLEMTWTMEVEE